MDGPMKHTIKHPTNDAYAPIYTFPQLMEMYTPSINHACDTCNDDRVTFNHNGELFECVDCINGYIMDAHTLYAPYHNGMVA